MLDEKTAATDWNYISNLPFETDAGIAHEAAIGLIVLATDQTMEHEFRQIVRKPGVAFYESRIPNSSQITPETLREMEALIADRTDVILPDLHLDVVAFGCTSASMVIGEEGVFAQIRKARPDAACTTPITAAFAAFDAFGAKNIGVLTPYRDDVNQQVREYIEGKGYRVPVFGSFNEEDDRIAARITTASIRQAIGQIAEVDAVEAVFLSCTSLRLAECAAEIEAEVGKPVTSSNHALAWHCLRLAGVDDKLPEFGRLYTL
ncbi:MAG: aspartate/glutamate racemase family protein [Alphaproteobacteria bacterium]|nr:aspartate/glutamate racemase family protein [Alphaproteobacteria bacterium]